MQTHDTHPAATDAEEPPATTDPYTGFPPYLRYRGGAERVDLDRNSWRRFRSAFSLLAAADDAERNAARLRAHTDNVLCGAACHSAIGALLLRSRLWGTAARGAVAIMLADVAETVALRALARAGVDDDAAKAAVRDVLAEGGTFHARAGDE